MNTYELTGDQLVAVVSGGGSSVLTATFDEVPLCPPFNRGFRRN